MILPEEMESVGLLRNLGEPHVRRLASLASLQECSEGTVLFQEGTVSSCLYFVLRGRVSLEVEAPEQGPVQVFTAGPGDLLGWSPVLGRKAMTATGRAVTRCRLALLDARELETVCEQDPKFAAAFLRQTALVLSDRLQRTRRLLARALGHRQLSQIVPEHSE
jgi:CRP-like cAMP-binding protein